MRLIDADALKARMIAFMAGASTTYLVAENIMMMINQADTVDAVPVVRCKDCMHDGLSTCAICYIENKTLAFINHDPDFYCAYGERKEETDGRD